MTELQILERPAARELGLRKYFTGRICRNGHMAERYTQSGTCQECINGAMQKSREEYANSPEQVARKAAYAAALRLQAETYVIRVRAPLASLDSIRTLVGALLTARIPGADSLAFIVELKPSGYAGNTAMVSLRVHRDDEIAVRSMLAHALGNAT